MSNTIAGGIPARAYIISEDSGQFERLEIKRSPLTGVDSLLKQLAQEIPTFIPKMFMIPAGPVHFSFSSKMLTLAVLLPTIRLLTLWSVVRPPDKRQKAYLIPVFQGADTLRLAPVWTPPSNMRVFFCNHMQANGSGVYLHTHAALVAIRTDDKDDRKCYKLPLPNMYENCKLCMGGTPTQELQSPEMLKRPIADQMQAAVDSFNRSTWNGDLLSHNRIETVEAMFQFSAEDNVTQVNPMKDWHLSLPAVSNTDFATIPFHSL